MTEINANTTHKLIDSYTVFGWSALCSCGHHVDKFDTRAAAEQALAAHVAEATR